MKRCFLIYLLFLSGPVNGQIISFCIYFGSEDKIEFKSNFGFFRSLEDFNNGIDLPVERIDFRSNLLGQYKITITNDGKKEKTTYEELSKKYWGYHFYHQVFRFDSLASNVNNHWELQCIGKICLYASHPFEIVDHKIDENGLHHYSYKYEQYTTIQGGISVGLEGKVLELTNENFIHAISLLDEDIEQDYINELKELKDVKRGDIIKNSNSNMLLFIKYFELVNDGFEK